MLLFFRAYLTRNFLKHTVLGIMMLYEPIIRYVCKFCMKSYFTSGITTLAAIVYVDSALTLVVFCTHVASLITY
jgi:hypothetical protein